ncbi:MAG: hypothetical protein AMJ69_12800, partial [Gammaproteobacteria bacterium SG8_47]
SDIEETANKFGAVFGNASSTVQKQLDDISKRTGATGMQLQDMASNIGALVKPALGTAQAAGEMGVSVAELALDISSFNNVTSEEALIALRSGLIGSAEPLQRFGVDVRVAALEQEALRQGITTSIQAMTEGQRVALRYAAIQRQLGTQGATGDATRTAKGFANASRNLWSALKEIVGIMMGFLLPAITKLVNKTRVIVDETKAWFKENKALIKQRVEKFLERVGRVISAVVTFFGRIAKATRDWYDELGPTAKVFARIAAIAAAIAVALLLPGVPMLLLIALIGLLIEDFEMWRKGGESVIGDIIGLFKALGGTIAEWASNAKTKVVSTWEGIKTSVSAAIDSIIASIDRIIAAVKKSIDEFNKWRDTYKTGISFVSSLAAGAAVAYGIHWVKANKLAIEWFVKARIRAIRNMIRTKLFAIKSAWATSIAWMKAAARSTASWMVFQAWKIRLYIHLARKAVVSAARTSAAWVAAAVKAGAAWLAVNIPLALTAVALAIIIGTVIFLARELWKLATGQENFFTTMYQGFMSLADELGGIGAAFKDTLDTALKYWLKFIGLSETAVDKWATRIKKVVSTIWKISAAPLNALIKAGEFIGEQLGFFDAGSSEGAAGGGGRIAGRGRIAATPGAGRGALINQGQQTNTFNVTARPGESDEDLARRLAEMVPPMIARENDRNLKAAARDYALEAG